MSVPTLYAIEHLPHSIVHTRADCWSIREPLEREPTVTSLVNLYDTGHLRHCSHCAKYPPPEWIALAAECVRGRYLEKNLPVMVRMTWVKRMKYPYSQPTKRRPPELSAEEVATRVKQQAEDKKRREMLAVWRSEPLRCATLGYSSGVHVGWSQKGAEVRPRFDRDYPYD